MSSSPTSFAPSLTQLATYGKFVPWDAPGVRLKWAAAFIVSAGFMCASYQIIPRLFSDKTNADASRFFVRCYTPILAPLAWFTLSLVQFPPANALLNSVQITEIKGALLYRYLLLCISIATIGNLCIELLKKTE